MNGQRLLAASILAIVAGLSIASFRSSGTPTSEIALKKGLPPGTVYIRNNFGDGDAIKVVPAWNEAHWIHFKGIGEGTKRFPFPALLRSDRCDVITLAKPKRIWVLGTHGRPPKPPEPIFDSLEPLQTKHFDDGTAVALYEMPALGITSSFSSSLAKTRISRRDSAGKERDCKRVRNRFRCGKKPWENPSIETRDVFHNEVSWVLTHPPNNDETLVIRWPIEQGKALIVRAGFTLKAVRREQGSPVSIKIFIDDDEVDGFEMQPHKYHLELRVLPLPSNARTVRFEVRAADHEYRQLMLEADIASTIHSAILGEATYNGLD